MSTKFLAILLALGLTSLASTGLGQTPAPPAGAAPAGAAPAAPDADPNALPEELKKLGAITEGKGRIGSNAEIEVPQGFVFFPARGAREMMKRWGNLVDGNEDGLITHAEQGWSVLFSFSDEGYVKDEDKDQLDEKKMFQMYKDSEPAINEERKRQGVAAIHIIKFELPPTYNEKTNNLEWALRFTIEGEPGQFVNYYTKLLGRRGIMTANLMVGPDDLKATLPEYQKLLTKFTYTKGETYAEYRSGDKLATYGLAGLVVGGGAVAAAKMGLFAKFFALIAKGGKAVIAGIVVVLAGIAKFFGKLFGRREQKQFEQ